jgi:hypothetical protein
MRPHATHYNPTRGGLSREGNRLPSLAFQSIIQSIRSPTKSIKLSIREEVWWPLKGTAAMAHQHMAA